MATKLSLQPHTPLGSMYCSDPNCKSCNQLKEVMKLAGYDEAAPSEHVSKAQEVKVERNVA